MQVQSPQRRQSWDVEDVGCVPLRLTLESSEESELSDMLYCTHAPGSQSDWKPCGVRTIHCDLRAVNSTQSFAVNTWLSQTWILGKRKQMKAKRLSYNPQRNPAMLWRHEHKISSNKVTFKGITQKMVFSFSQLLLFMHMCMSVSACMCLPVKTRKGSQIPEVEVTGAHEPPNMSTRNQICVLHKSNKGS